MRILFALDSAMNLVSIDRIPNTNLWTQSRYWSIFSELWHPHTTTRNNPVHHILWMLRCIVLHIPVLRIGKATESFPDWSHIDKHWVIKVGQAVSEFLWRGSMSMWNILSAWRLRALLIQIGLLKSKIHKT